MTKQAPEDTIDVATTPNANFQDYPEIQKWMRLRGILIEKIEQSATQGDYLESGERLAHAWNCMMDFWLGFADAANEVWPGSYEQAAIAKQVLDSWDRHTPRQLSLGEERAIHVALAYQDGFRLESTGSKDAPMDAALQIAALIEGLSSESGPETIRKSIQRFRDELAGQEMFRLNRKTLKLEVFDATSVLLEGLPNRRGRPPSRNSPPKRPTE
jgi:hypothetical protein